MVSLTVRKLSDENKSRLRIRAARNGRSMEEEAREILRVALASPDLPPENLALAIGSRFRALGGVELPLEKRSPLREPPVFEP